MKQSVVRLGVCFLFAFLFATVQSNAQTSKGSQSYMGVASATLVLDQEISAMNGELALLQFDTPAYENKQYQIWFYAGVKRQLDNNANVATAVAKNFSNLSKVKGMEANAKIWHLDVIDLISN